MQHRVTSTLAHARGAAENKQWNLLCPCISGGVRDFQPTSTVGNRHNTKTFNACISIGGKTCALLVTGDQHMEVFVAKGAKHSKSEVSDNSESLMNAEFAKAANEVVGDRRRVVSRL